ncbi:MAG: four helix bundle protein [Patescibacteria group bacterium]|jgi:four helix bundle protein
MSNPDILNLEERTAKFGEAIIHLCQESKVTIITEPIIRQIIRSATSIGANYMEANGACSKSDFRNKIFICKKETMETKHWLRMLSSALPDKSDELRELWKEAQELTLIFSKIAGSLKSKN